MHAGGKVVSIWICMVFFELALPDLPIVHFQGYSTSTGVQIGIDCVYSYTVQTQFRMYGLSILHSLHIVTIIKLKYSYVSKNFIRVKLQVKNKHIGV